MNARDLVELKIALEFGSAPERDILLLAKNAESQPRLLVSHHRDGESMYFRSDVPPSTRERLRALGMTQALADQSAAIAILSRDAPVVNVWRVRWYTVERHPEPAEYAEVTFNNGRHILVRDGLTIAQAWDAQACPGAVEVEVETHPDFRRRGFARQVVASWAARALEDNRIAYYSHTVENDASAALARSLKLTWLSDEVEYQ
jgi:hypothetical protein